MSRETTPTAPGRMPQTVIVPLLAALFAYVVVLYQPAVFNDGDTWWHVATGLWIIDHRAVPFTDPFSHTMPGAPWHAHEWLSELFFGLAYKAGGWTGVATIAALASALAAGLLARRLAKSLGGLSLVATLVLGLACLAPSLLARPHVLALPILVAWVAELLAARDEDRAPRLPFVLLMVLWANMHGGYVLGMALMGPFALEALIAAPPSGRFKVVRDWGVFGVAALIACMVTPHGPAGLLFPFQLMTMDSLPYITEWKPTDFSEISPFEIVLLATLFVGFSRGVKVPLLRLLTLLLLFHMALQHGRHQFVLVVIAPMVLAPHLAEALGNVPGAAPSRRAAWQALAVTVVGLVLLGVPRMIWPMVRADGGVTPSAAVAHVPAEIARRPVFNDYSFGGYLVFEGIRPYIDGRADMYGDAFMHRYAKLAAANPAAVDAEFKRYDIAWTLLTPDHPLNALLAKRPEWRRLYGDQTAVVYVRKDVAP